MKISQKQASLLAREIHAQLTKKKVFKISDVLKEKIKQFISKREQLQNSVKEAEALVQKHDSGLLNIVGKEMNRKVEAYYNFQRMVDRIEEKNMPTISEIEDEIILKSMFASEDDMQAFVDSIVEKHSKKLQSKVLQN